MSLNSMAPSVPLFGFPPFLSKDVFKTQLKSPWRPSWVCKIQMEKNTGDIAMSMTNREKVDISSFVASILECTLLIPDINRGLSVWRFVSFISPNWPSALASMSRPNSGG